MAKSERQAKLDAFAREQGFDSYWKYRNAQDKKLGYEGGSRERQQARKTGRGLKGADVGARPGERPRGRRRAKPAPPRVAPGRKQVTPVGKHGHIVETTSTPDGAGGWGVLYRRLGMVPAGRPVQVTATVLSKSGPRTVQFRATAGEILEAENGLQGLIIDAISSGYSGNWSSATILSCQLLIPSSGEEES